jgi:hypothetical protein
MRVAGPVEVVVTCAHHERENRQPQLVDEVVLEKRCTSWELA